MAQHGSGTGECKKCLILLATPAGFEPATFSLEGKNHAIGSNWLQ
jgi:hypothetical protein